MGATAGGRRSGCASASTWAARCAGATTCSATTSPSRARVADQAAGGEILITEPVRRAVGDVPGIELGGRRAVDLKGVRDSPDLYPVLMPVDH